MKKFKLTVDEEELKALIRFHSANILDNDNYEIERSQRIHDLTKRLNKETPEIEPVELPQAIAAKEEQQSGW
jgi:pyruvate-formate lyase-activating enzyme